MSDQKVLSLLYGPLLGHDAFMMYHMLYHLNHGSDKVYQEDFILALLNVKNEQLIKARHILESFELLQTFSKENALILQLKRPLTAKGFLTDVIFGVYLEQTMGQPYIDTIISSFKVDTKEIETYTNISKTFSDMYTFSHHELLKVDASLYDNGGHKSRRKTFELRLEEVFESLPKRYQKPQLLKQDMKDALNQLAFIYQYTLEDLKEIILRLDPKTLDSKPQLLLQAKMYYHQKEKTLDIKPSEDDHLKAITEASPYYIIKKYGTMDQYANSLDTVMQLVSRNHVEIGIINTLLLFVLKRKQGVLPHINYLEKILSSWLSKGVQKTQDATELVSMIENQYVSSKPKTKTRSVEPDWFEDYLKELEDEESKR
jgi:replication initiation and membrane attachment protein